MAGCERDNGGYTRSAYLIVGDSVNCTHTSYKPGLVFGSLVDSFDIDYDFEKDLIFSRNSVYIDDCEAFLANCPPNLICDCFPTIYTDYCINLANTIEIAVDHDSAVHQFLVNDTISNKNKWSHTIKHPLYHRDIYDPYWTGSKEYYLGLKVIRNEDTLYSWVNISISNYGFTVKESVIQK